MWIANVRKYYEKNILNDGANHPFLAFWVDVHYPYGLLRKKGVSWQSRVETSRSAFYRRRVWFTFIRQMLLSDVKIIPRGEIEEEDDSPGFSYTDIVLSCLLLLSLKAIG